MLQEIITYIIILAAAALAVWKMYNKLRAKKKNPVQTGKKLITTPHNCSDCIAECSLRDAVPAIRKENEELCETTVVKINKT